MAVAEIAKTTGQDVQSLAAEMVTEAIKLRRVPTIHFEDGAVGRRACVPGTGIPIWEIAEYCEYANQSFEELQRGFDWIGKHHLEAAIDYYRAFPEDIKPHIKTEEEARGSARALGSAPVRQAAVALSN